MEAIEILVSGDDGPQRHVTGYHATEHFAVYRDTSFYHHWHVSHIGTHRKAVGSCESFELAICRAKALQAVDGIDWSLTSKDELKKQWNEPGVWAAIGVARKVELPVDDGSLL